MKFNRGRRRTRINNAIVSITRQNPLHLAFFSFVSERNSVQSVQCSLLTFASAWNWCTFVIFGIAPLNRHTRLIQNYCLIIMSSRFSDAMASTALAHISCDSIFDSHAWKTLMLPLRRRLLTAAMIDCVIFTPSEWIKFRHRRWSRTNEKHSKK